MNDMFKAESESLMIRADLTMKNKIFIDCHSEMVKSFGWETFETQQDSE